MSKNVNICLACCLMASMIYTHHAFGANTDGTITKLNVELASAGIASTGICATDSPLPSNSVEIAYDDGCWDNWGYNVQNRNALSSGWPYQGVRVRFTAPSTAGGKLLEARVVDWTHWGDGKAKIVIYDKDDNYIGEVEQDLVANEYNFQVIDVSSLDFTPGPGNDFYIAFEPGGDICLDGTNGLVVGDDSSAPDGRSELRSGDCNNYWQPVYDADHFIRAVVGSGNLSCHDTAIAKLQEAMDAVKALPLAAFKTMQQGFNTPNNQVKRAQRTMQRGLVNQINTAITGVKRGQYAAALHLLQRGILFKTDGCAEADAPDKNDWLKDCDSQAQVYPLLKEAIECLESMIQEG